MAGGNFCELLRCARHFVRCYSIGEYAARRKGMPYLNKQQHAVASLERTDHLPVPGAVEG